MTDYRTETEKIEAAIQTLHTKISILAAQHKYDDMSVIVAEIAELEARKASVNKVDELLILYKHVQEYERCNDHFQDWGRDYHDGTPGQKINKALFNSLIAVVKQLDAKISGKYPVITKKIWKIARQEGNTYYVNAGTTVCYAPFGDIDVGNQPSTNRKVKFVETNTHLHVCNETFSGDPAPGQTKFLWVFE